MKIILITAAVMVACIIIPLMAAKFCGFNRLGHD